MPWSELLAFLNGGFQELLETDFQQIRYGDVGVAAGLGLFVVGVLKARL